jgi:threonine/homoserine/homoserine lactone efflux protein
MFIDLFLRGLITGFLISLPIGPLGVLVIQRTANLNFKAGFSSGLGVATTDTIWALLAGFSVSFIISFLETYQLYIQILGAVLLFLLGLNIFFSHPKTAWKKMRRKGTNSFEMYITGVGISFSNPLTVLAYIAIFAGLHIVFSIHDIAEPVSFMSGFYIGAACWWLILTTAISLIRHKFNLRILWWFNKISGSAIMLFVIASTIYILIKGSPNL